MFHITKDNVDTLLVGSLFCGTGGGLDSTMHRRLFDSALKAREKLPVKKIEEFHSADYLATIYGVGDPSKTTGIGSTLLKQALKKYQQYTHLAIKGILPGELGAEGLAFLASAYLDLPVVDTDLVGGRAAPEIQMDVFSVYKIPITPVLGASINKKLLLLDGIFSAHEVEQTLREFFEQNGKSGILVGYPIKAGLYKKIGARETLSRAISYGGLIEHGELESLLRNTGGKILAQTVLKKTNLKSEGGFLVGKIFLADGLSVNVKNENISLYRNARLIARAPDIIVLLDDAKRPVHNAHIKEHIGKKITILCLPATDYWKKTENTYLWKD